MEGRDYRFGNLLPFTEQIFSILCQAAGKCWFVANTISISMKGNQKQENLNV